jgi:hypothetical protein
VKGPCGSPARISASACAGRVCSRSVRSCGRPPREIFLCSNPATRDHDAYHALRAIPSAVRSKASCENGARARLIDVEDLHARAECPVSVSRYDTGPGFSRVFEDSLAARGLSGEKNLTDQIGVVVFAAFGDLAAFKAEIKIIALPVRSAVRRHRIGLS